MANLVIDIGNTSTKVAVFNNDDLLYTNQHQKLGTGALDVYFDKYPIKRAILSTVKNTAETWEEQLKRKTELTYFKTTTVKN